MVDITDRKRAEEAFRQSTARLANAQRIANLGSFDADVRTGKREWSEEQYRIFGRHPDEFEPSLDSVTKSVHPDDRKKFTERLGQALENS